MKTVKFISINIWFAVELIYYICGDINNINWWIILNARNYLLASVFAVCGLFESDNNIYRMAYLTLSIIFIFFFFMELSYLNSNTQDYSQGVISRIFSRGALLIYTTLLILITYKTWASIYRT